MATLETNVADRMCMLNVKQPWANALVGKLPDADGNSKDVENRGYPIPATHTLPFWVVVVASKSVPTRRAMGLLHSMTKTHVMDARSFPRQAIVGMVEITGCTQQSDSKWYAGTGENGRNHAWTIGGRIAFDQVDVDGIRGCQAAFHRVARHPKATHIMSVVERHVKPEEFIW